MRSPGIEPGSQRWERRILPLNHKRNSVLMKDWPTYDSIDPNLQQTSLRLGQKVDPFCRASCFYFVLRISPGYLALRNDVKVLYRR